DEYAARGHVRMLRRFTHGQDRREADIGAFHDSAPLLAGLALEDLDQFLAQLWPRLRIHLRVIAGAPQSGMLAQQRVKLRCDGADRDEMAPAACIDAVEMR